MSAENSIKHLKRTIARYAFFTVSWIINKLPYGMVKGLTSALVSIGYALTIRQKQIARESLNIAFGKEKSKDEINKIVRSCFENLGRGMIELMYFMDHPAMIKTHVLIEGKGYLEQAFKEKKGVIGISAHFGTFPLMLLRFVQEGYKTNAIIRSTRDEVIEKHFLKQRTQLGLTTVYSHPRLQCVNTSIKVLRENQLLFIPLDQNFGSGGGVFVDFFGQKAATATGPVVFAMRTGAPLVPMFIIREKDDQHKIIIDSPLHLEYREDDKETILINTARITQVIERYVRQYPQEWGWMHRRWKSKPK